jgi:nucleotide-binding universal stress UspA family protein
MEATGTNAGQRGGAGYLGDAVDDAADAPGLRGRILSRLGVFCDDDLVLAHRYAAAAVRALEDAGAKDQLAGALFYAEVLLGTAPRRDLLERAVALEDPRGHSYHSTVPGIWHGRWTGGRRRRAASGPSGPVVVVRGRGHTATGPVVVGVDGTPAAEVALVLGFEEAAPRGMELVAVRAFTTPLPPQMVGVALPAPQWGEVEEATRAALADSLAPWHGKYPQVRLSGRAVAGGAGHALTNLSAEAGLLVVGCRGHGALVGTLLGSVSTQLLHHADCPVLVAHAERGGPRR